MSWLSDLFGGSAKKAQARADEQAAANRALINSTAKPYQSLTEIPVGKSLNDTILAALNQGKGIGYGDEWVGKTTNPYIASREARWNETELPQLSSEMSGRGLGRSTIAQGEINQASATKERDINELVANAYTQNEAQKKLDQARYENLGMNWTGAEAAQQGNYVSADQARTKALMGVNDAYYDQTGANEASKTSDINQLIGTGLNLAGTVLAPATGGASLTASNIASELTKVNEAKNASAFTKKKTSWA